MKIRNTFTFASITFVFCFVSLFSVEAQDQIGKLFTVNSATDSSDAVAGDGVCADSGGQCTLRAAIEESNATLARDVIVFDLTQPAVIDLTIGELSISRNLDIVGPGARLLTIRRSSQPNTPAFRIFHVLGDMTEFTLRGATVRNGNSLSGGALFTEPGGVIRLSDSAFVENRATLAGGALAVQGKLRVLRCLLSSNTAETQGGAIVNLPATSDLVVLNSTLTGNSAAIGGAIYNQGKVLLANNTITENSAGTSSSIFAGPLGTVQVINTIIGRDLGQPATALQGNFQSFGTNIVTDSRGSTGFTNGVNGDQVSENNVIDPMLGPLSDNGGQTDTRALLVGSPAINTGNNCVLMRSCSTTPVVDMFWDQRRGFGRFPLSIVDIGSFEVEASSSSGSFGAFGIFVFNGARYTGSIAVMTNSINNSKRYAPLNPFGSYRFSNLGTDVNVLEIRSKRASVARGPVVLDIEPFTQQFPKTPADVRDYGLRANTNKKGS